MQETFEYFASLVVDENPQAVKMLVELAKNKRNKEVTRLEEKYSENLYDVIGDDNPFEETT